NLEVSSRIRAILLRDGAIIGRDAMIWVSGIVLLMHEEDLGRRERRENIRVTARAERVVVALQRSGTPQSARDANGSGKLHFDLFFCHARVAMRIQLDRLGEHHAPGTVHLNTTTLVYEVGTDDGRPSRFGDDASDVLILIPLRPFLRPPPVEYEVHGAE